MIGNLNITGDGKIMLETGSTVTLERFAQDVCGGDTKLAIALLCDNLGMSEEQLRSDLGLVEDRSPVLVFKSEHR